MSPALRKLLVVKLLLIPIVVGICTECAQTIPDTSPNAIHIAQTQTAEPVATMWARLAITSETHTANQTWTPTPSPIPTIAYPILITEHTFQEYTIRIYQNSSWGNFEILSGTETVYKLANTQSFWLESPYKGQAELERIAMGQDITGDGKANLIVGHWTGGAYCCTYFQYFPPSVEN
jgi:hypothetical protein